MSVCVDKVKTMELWDVYDQDRQLTGKTMMRDEPSMQGHFHLVVHVCLFNQKGEMLIQKRQQNKEGWPGLWDLSAGGSALQGETSQQAAQREVLEELGLKLDLHKMRANLSVNFEEGFDDLFLLPYEVSLTELVLQKEEVAQVAWASMQEILTMIDQGSFIPYYPGLIQYLFENYGRLGAIR